MTSRDCFSPSWLFTVNLARTSRHDRLFAYRRRTNSTLKAFINLHDGEVIGNGGGARRTAKYEQAPGFQASYRVTESQRERRTDRAPS